MQKRIVSLLFILFLFFTHTTLPAQMNTSLGLKAGGNYSFQVGSDVHGSKSLTAPYGGIIVRLTEADNEWMKYVFQGEVLYSIVGSKAPNDQMTLTYVNVPITVQRYFGYSSFFLEGGPQVGFLVSAKEKINDLTKDVKENIQPINFTMNLGLGYLTHSGLGLNTRFGYGITSNLKNYDSHNAVVSFGLFYVFNYGTRLED